MSDYFLWFALGAFLMWLWLRDRDMDDFGKMR